MNFLKLSDEEKAKLDDYNQGIDQEQLKKEAIKKYFEKHLSDTSRAMDIVNNPDKTQEDQQFADEQLGPVVQGVMGGGTMGSVGGGIKPAFKQIQKMMQVGNKVAPVQNTAQALQLKQVLEQNRHLPPTKFGRTIIRD